MNDLDLLQERALRALEEITHGTHCSKSDHGSTSGGGEGPASVEVRVKTSPTCALCGADTIPHVEDAYALIPGQWMYNKEQHAMLLVLDPNVEMAVVRLANGQLALRFGNTDSGPVFHAESKCLHQILGWAPEMFAEERFHLEEEG